MLNLLILLTERMAIIVTLAFILTRTQVFKRMVDQKLNTKTKILLSFIFGLFGILGTYAGIPVSTDASYLLWVPKVNQIYFDYVLANLRSVGVIIGGLLGGPYVGLGAGVIAGGHRLLLGGFTGLACGISPVLEGIIAGYIGNKSGSSRIASIQTTFLTGLLLTSIHLALILTISKPFDKALELVSLIAIPMIFANSIGAALFVAIIKTVIQDEDRIEANQAQKILHIADKMLFHLRQGLNNNSAQQILKIIYGATKVSAISITDQEKILGHIGVGSDHHIPGNSILTKATQEVLITGKLAIIKSKKEIDCNCLDCPLVAAVICPLKKSDEVIGVLKFYYLNPNFIKPVDIEFAEGIGNLLSHQLEVAEAENQVKLRNIAEIKALQAQIHPHFLFNSLNTVIALIRTDPDTARDLLIQLGSFLRKNLNSSQNALISLQQEVEHTQAFLNIEKIRFYDRLNLRIEIEPGLEHVLIPPLTLQPLVENSIKHGLKDVISGGIITIQIKKVFNEVNISITDNGIGISLYNIQKYLRQKNTSNNSGLGLSNVHQRLIGHFGAKSGLNIKNAPDGGTIITFRLPLGEGDVYENKNSHCG